MTKLTKVIILTAGLLVGMAGFGAKEAHAQRVTPPGTGGGGTTTVVSAPNGGSTIVAPDGSDVGTRGSNSWVRPGASVVVQHRFSGLTSRPAETNLRVGAGVHFGQHDGTFASRIGVETTIPISSDRERIVETNLVGAIGINVNDPAFNLHTGAEVVFPLVYKPIGEISDRHNQRVSGEVRQVERVVERPVERVVERPVERVVERSVERPVERVVERPAERPVERIVERPASTPYIAPRNTVTPAPVARQVATQSVVETPVVVNQINNTTECACEKFWAAFNAISAPVQNQERESDEPSTPKTVASHVDSVLRGAVLGSIASGAWYGVQNHLNNRRALKKFDGAFARSKDFG